MQRRDRDILVRLLTETRVLSLGVLVDGMPYVGLLPFVAENDFGSLLVHASQLARHSRGLQQDAPFSVLIHGVDDPEGDPLQVPRVSLSGTVELVARSNPSYTGARDAYLHRFPTSAATFQLGDFNLYRLRLASGRLVAGFARAVNLRRESFADLNEP